MKRFVAAAAVALAVVGGACGGGGEDARGVASIGGQQARAGDDGGGKPKASKEDRERAALAFARCMRQNGIDMPDPGGDGTVMVRRATRIDSTREEMEKAEAACKKEREALQGTIGEPPADLQDKMLKMARCMRSKGIDMPDPSSSPNGATRVELGPDTLEDPKFLAAQEACRKEVGLPEPGFEGGDGPAGPAAAR